MSKVGVSLALQFQSGIIQGCSPKKVRRGLCFRRAIWATPLTTVIFPFIGCTYEIIKLTESPSKMLDFFMRVTP